MGIIKRGILGGFSNKVANVVGTSWKGRAVIKALPLSVANPRTTPQVNQRTKFSSCAVFASLLLGQWIKPLWDRWAGDISGYNAFVKENTAFFNPDGTSNSSFLVLSKGRMLPVGTASVTADKSLATIAGTVEMPVDIAWGQTGSEIYVTATKASTPVPLGFDVVTGNPGDNISYSISTNDFEVGDIIFVYFTVKRNDGTQVSNSTDLMTTAVA